MLNYSDALQLFSLKDLYETRDIAAWEQEFERKYRLLIMKFNPKNSKDKKHIDSYQLVLEAYKVLKEVLNRKKCIREELPTIVDHTSMTNSLLPSFLNPVEYKRDLNREQIHVEDFITNPDDFNSVFDYNIEKFKTMDETIRASAFDPSDNFSVYGQNRMEESYKPLFQDLSKIKYENKKSTKKPAAIVDKSNQQILEERRRVDREIEEIERENLSIKRRGKRRQ